MGSFVLANMSRSVSVTCTAPVNIAVIKYWGKRDSKLLLPTNSSISGTLDQKDMCSTTTVMIGDHIKESRMWLNGKEESITNPRLQNCLRECRLRAKEIKDKDGKVIFTEEEAKKLPVHICSRNNFPTAAGLASSASGYACLAFTLGQVFQIKDPKELTIIARMGSGS